MLARCLCDYSQAFLFLLKFDPGLFQNPRFNLGVPHAQQVDGALSVVLFRRRARFVSHDLRGYAYGRFYPLAERAKGTAQAMQRDMGQASGLQGSYMGCSRVSHASGLAVLARATEHPLIAAG